MNNDFFEGKLVLRSRVVSMELVSNVLIMLNVSKFDWLILVFV